MAPLSKFLSSRIWLFVVILLMVASLGRAADSKIADVYGRAITERERAQMPGIINSAIFERYGQDHHIQATEKEIAAFTDGMAQLGKKDQAERTQKETWLKKALKKRDLPSAERKKMEDELKASEQVSKNPEWGSPPSPDDKSWQQIGRGMVFNWKLNRALYQEFGGRVIFQQAGAEPLDAYRQLLEQKEKEGAFHVLDAKGKKAFWEYLTNDAMHTFLSQKEGARAMRKPWWVPPYPKG